MVNRFMQDKAKALAKSLEVLSLATFVLLSVAHGEGKPAPDPVLRGPAHSTITVASSVTSAREAALYRQRWGIDDIHVRSTASGSLIRFSYRVVDADKAKPIADKRASPLLVDETTHLALQVPVMEKIGQLRQVSQPQSGREYWMAFSNKGHHVVPGSHVSLVIGSVRMEGLVVEGGLAETTSISRVH